MKLIGLMPCRNEDWVVGLSARVALMWCDELMLLVHASTDRTAEIAAEISCEFPDRAWVAYEDNPRWDEMEHREQLLAGARARGATHIAIVDADEVLTGNLLGTIRPVIERMSGSVILQLPGYNLRGGINRYHANGIWGNRWFSVAFPDDLRLGWHGDRFHAREPQGMRMNTHRPMPQGGGGVMHLWGASERRLRAKHSAYKCVELLRWPERPVREIDRQYSMAVYPSAAPQFDQRWAYAETPAQWWAPYAGLMKHLDVDAVPWQEAEVQRLCKEHGASKFAGLDLFDVDKESLATFSV